MPKQIELKSAVKAGTKAAINTVTKSDAEEVTDYASAYMDSLLDSVNGALGDKLSSLYMGAGGSDDGPSVDVIMLLATLALSKLGIVLTVNLDWSAFDDAFGWVSSLSILNTITVPSVDHSVIVAIVGVALLVTQPLCVVRMNWLAREHQHTLPAFPAKFRHTWLTRNTVMRMFPLTLSPPTPGVCGCSFLTPLNLFLWVAFWVTFIASLATGNDIGAGLSFFLLALPAAYFACVNYFRSGAWQYANLRMSEAVKVRQYENLCMREGSFVLFVFVASHSFVTNFFIQEMTSWSGQSGGVNALLVVGFIVYFIAPLVYVHRIITDESADRTFRLFRSQLVDAFKDEQMYTKIALLVENVLFALTVLTFSSSDAGQLTGGFVVGLIFLLYYVFTRPYEDDMENYTDLIARFCSVATVLVGLILATDSNASGPAVSAVLIAISSIGTLWFLYTLDIKEMLLSQFFLMLQLYAQSKAATYTETRIQQLPDKKVRHLIKSPIELSVLSAKQKILFAVHRKELFFSGKLITKLSDLGVTWLDLQQCGYDVTSLKALGFSTEELMEVDAQLDDMGDRSDIRALYEGAYRDALALKEGKEDRDTLALLHTLGVFYRDLGEHVMAMEHLQRCWESRKTVLGPTDVDSLESMHYIGAYRTFLGSAALGTQQLRDAYKMCCDHHDLGPEHAKTLAVMASLGENLNAAQFAKEGIKILAERLEIVLKQAEEEGRRPDHPCTLEARLDYADVLLAGGNLLAVKNLNLKRVMNRQKTIYGADAPETLRLLDKFVDILQKMGRHRDALFQNLECVSEKMATMGVEHSGTLKSKFALARTYVELSKTKELDQLQLDRSLALQEERLGRTHPTVISSKVKLGALHNMRNKMEEAFTMMTAAHDCRVASLGAEHELTLGVANNLAVMNEAVGKSKEAHALYNNTLNLLLAKYGEDHQVTIALMSNYAIFLQNSGDLDTAKAMYDRVHGITKRILGDQHPLTIQAVENFGAFAIIRQEFAAGAQVYERILPLKQTLYEECHPHYVGTLENLASCYNRMGRAQESIALYRKVKQLYEEFMGFSHPKSIKARAGLAIALCEVGQAPESLVLIQACIRDGTVAFGPDHSTITEYIAVLGHVYIHLRQNELALKYTDEALQRTVKMYGPNHHQAKQYQAKKDWLLNVMSGNSAANDQAAQAAQQAAQQAAVAQSAQVEKMRAMNPMVLAMFQGAQEKSNKAQQFASANQFAQAIAIYQEVFADNDLLAHVDTEEGKTVQLNMMLMNMKMNYCICLYKSGQEHPTVELLEELLLEMQALDPPAPVQGLAMARQILNSIYTGTKKHDKALASMTANWKYLGARFGEASEEAITAVNERANYHFALKDYKSAMADHQEVLRLLILLQGADHPDTAKSISDATDMFKKVGVKFVPFPNKK